MTEDDDDDFDDLDPALVALEQSPDGLVVYHATAEQAASAILADGFRDATGSYMLPGVDVTGVWVSNRPLSANEGTKGGVLLRIVLRLQEADLADFELLEKGKTYREWCVPAALLNAKSSVDRAVRE